SAPKASEPLRIGVFVYPGFAPFFIAQEKDFFSRHGVNAQIVLLNDPQDSLAALSSGQVDMISSSADTAVIFADGGADVREILASDIGYGSDGILVRDDVNQISDLNGKTIYLAVGSPSYFLFRYVTSEEGLSASDFNLVDMPADQVGAAFLAGKLDYGVSWEPWLSAANQRSDGKVLLSSQDRSGLITDTFVVRTSVLRARRPEVVGVLQAWFDSVDYLESNPTEATDIMARHLSISPASLFEQLKTVRFLSVEENLERFDSNRQLGLSDLTLRASQILTTDGLMNAPVDPATLLDSSVLRDLFR
ncbi:MAG: ABC transporter substrate-binding protein, partial [Candidatus Diapherotrites archaeon]|nr:ABC transporter substrate-binding protein [Candidatus Diapherotrites archaeon]